MFDMQLIEAAHRNVRLLLEQCDVPYWVPPFDDGLYQECIDDARRRGYPVDGDLSVRRCLREGVVYAATAGAHLPHRQTQIWIALYTSCAVYVDDVTERSLAGISSIYMFNIRFISGEPQANALLDAFADILRRASDLYLPVASQLIVSSTLRFVTACLLENETRSMKILSVAQEYPNYQRTMSGIGEGYGFMVFSKDTALNDYIQAIPEIALFIHNVNDVLSFYKEERVGEVTNQISTQAARTEKSKLEIFGELTGTTIDLYKRIVNILEGSPEARETFKRFTAGNIYFHTSLARYRLEDLKL